MAACGAAQAEAGVNLADAEPVDDVKARRRELDVQRIERMRPQRRLLDLQIERESGGLISAEQVTADVTRGTGLVSRIMMDRLKLRRLL